MRKVCHHPQHLAVSAQLVVGSHAVGIQGDESDTVGSMGASAQACQFGSGGGLADTSSTCQCEDSTFFVQRWAFRVCSQVALQNVHHPTCGTGCVQLLRHALQNGAREGWGVTRSDKLEHQVGLDRILARLSQPSQRVEAVFDQILHGVQLIDDALGDRCGSRLGCSGLANNLNGFGRVGWHLSGRLVSPKGAATFLCRRLCRLMAFAQHTFAYIVLKRQRAHRQLGYIIFDFGRNFLVTLS